MVETRSRPDHTRHRQKRRVVTRIEQKLGGDQSHHPAGTPDPGAVGQSLFASDRAKEKATASS